MSDFIPGKHPPNNATGAPNPPVASQELADLIPVVYDELRALAANQLRRERPNHTLQPTALVHEAYARLARQSRVRFAGRTHVIALAAEQMRRVLVEHARRRSALKRGRPSDRITFTDSLVLTGTDTVDFLPLHLALERLGEHDPTDMRVVVWRFFGGLTEAEIASELGVSDRSVRKRWSHARAWLRREMDRDGSPGADPARARPTREPKGRAAPPAPLRSPVQAREADPSGRS